MDNLWWLKVPNARGLIDYISKALLNEENVMLYHELSLPWRNTFVRMVKDEVRENNSLKGFDTINGISNPGNYLLNEYCKAEKRAQFRPSKGYANFLAESDDIVLHDKYLWVIIDSSEEYFEWVEFVTEYYKHRANGKDSAIFILECSGELVPRKRKGIKIVNVDNYINDYDKTVFATLIAAELPEPVLVKNYLTELMVSIAGNDIELMSAIVNNYDAFICRPYESLLELANKFEYSDGSISTLRIEKNSVDHAIWKSQIKIVYPLIEEYRKRFVEKHRSNIKLGLPIDASDGGQVFEPEEVELGGLVYLTGIKSLILPDREYHELISFKDARNTLSHLGILSFDEIKALFANN